jgi:formate--tetrahydrofolate ligase
MNGGVAKVDLARENLDALRAGIVNLGRHVENVRSFGLPVVVAINHFTTDTEAEHQLIADICRDEFGVEAVQCTHWANGAAGAEDLARKVVALCEGGTAHFQPIYPDHMPLAGKILTIATRIYGAAEIAIAPKAAADLAAFEAAGYGDLPVCMAKTQYSFSADPTLLGAPSGHIVPVREVRLSAGAGFVVAICGEIMTMPGLPKLPAAEAIHLNDKGQIEGLF